MDTIELHAKRGLRQWLTPIADGSIQVGLFGNSREDAHI
jgi:hypothetical protein